MEGRIVVEHLPTGSARISVFDPYNGRKVDPNAKPVPYHAIDRTVYKMIEEIERAGHRATVVVRGLRYGDA